MNSLQLHKINPSILEICWSQKLWLLASIVLAIVCSALCQLVIPKTFRVKNTLRIGQFMGNPLEMAEFTKQRFKQAAFLEEAFEHDGLHLDLPRDSLPNLVQVSIENDFNKQRGIDTILFSTQASSASMAAAMNRAISNYLIFQHQRIFEQAVGIRSEEIHGWEKSIEDAEAQIKHLESKLEETASGKTIDDLALYLLTAKLQELRSLLIQMNQLKHKARLETYNPVLSFNTKTGSDPREPEHAFFPRLSITLPSLILVSGFAWFLYCWMKFNLGSHEHN